MAEYMEREKVYEMLNALGGCGTEPESWADGWDKAIDTAIDELNKIPAADVRPERHAKLVIFPQFSHTKRRMKKYCKCSACGLKKELHGDLYFCSRCGAKLDGKEV